MSEKMVTITEREYNKLPDASLFLECLKGAGVDNWHGYEIAIDEYRESESENNE